MYNPCNVSNFIVRSKLFKNAFEESEVNRYSIATVTCLRYTLEEREALSVNARALFFSVRYDGCTTLAGI